jgi:hypothetical protein
MDGWMMDGWMDRWIDGWMDGWMNKPEMREQMLCFDLL